MSNCFSLIFAKKKLIMKFNKNLILSLCVLVVVSAVYRIIPNRPNGFAPQIAMALFGGAFFVKNKKWAFALPILSMFISDLFYQVLYLNQLTEMQGFYTGQWKNYLVIASLTVFGFMISEMKIAKVVLASLSAPTAYFLLSNTMVWMGNGGYQRPKTFSGFLQCMADGIPFYQNSILGTIVFSAILFGGYSLLITAINQKQQAI
jgi:uncharacterized membrane protein YhhN